jgi:hypothetical protein
VPHAHVYGARESLSPAAEKEAEWRSALSETYVLEGSQLVRRCNEKGGAGDPTPGAVPSEHVTRELSPYPSE